MWPAALVTAGATVFGRLFVVGILPSAVLTTVIWLLVRADAFRRSGLSATDLNPRDFDIGRGGLVLLFLLIVALLTAVMQSFHFGAVRLLEATGESLGRLWSWFGSVSAGSGGAGSASRATVRSR